MKAPKAASTDTSLQDRMRARVADRDALLHRLQEALSASESVSAAWLFGSLGRGEADALSDLDLFVVCPNTHIESMIAGRYDFMARIGKPLLVLEAPQNRPPHGAYNMALYEGQEGPLQVDWYWQPQYAALIPARSLVLLDRAELPRSDDPPRFDYQPVPERSRLEVVTQTINFFWVMLLITAKYVARSPHEERMGLLRFVRDPLRETAVFAGVALPATLMEDTPCPLPEQKMRLLRALLSEMERITPRAAEIGAHVPDAIADPARRYLRFVEAIAAAQPG